MRKYLFPILLGLLLLIPESAIKAQSTISWGVSVNSISAATSTATGTSYSLISTPASVITWTIDTTGTVTSQTVLLEGSNDNSTWFTLDSSTSITDVARTFTTSVKFIRARISAHGGGGGTTTVDIISKGSPWTANFFTGGTVTGQILSTSTSACVTPPYSFSGDPDTGFDWVVAGGGAYFCSNGAQSIRFGTDHIWVNSESAGIRFGASQDINLLKLNSPGVLSQRGGGTESRMYWHNASTGVAVSDGFSIQMSGGTEAYIWNYENGPLRFGSNNVEHWQISNGGTLQAVGAKSIFANAILLANAAGDVSTTGRIRLGNTGSINWRNAAGTADVIGISVNASDNITIGASGASTFFGGTIVGAGTFIMTSSGTAAAGAIRLVNNTNIAWRNAGNTADITFGATSSDTLSSSHPIGATCLAIGTSCASTDTNLMRFNDKTFAQLGTPANGTLVYCSDCTFANPCASGGTGAFAKRLNGIWRCD